MYHAIGYGDTHQRAPYNAPLEWQEEWSKRIKDLIDNYQPDHLYFDCSIPFRGDEMGKAANIRKAPWQTDDSMGPWGYKKGAHYMSADATIDKLVDIVSKNGNMLLNVPIRADGTLDKETIAILEDIGEWLKINGEAIYGTRPWYMFGEGPSNQIPNHVIESPYTARDIRYTTKDGDLYATVLKWPGDGKEIILEFLAPGNIKVGEIDKIKMLGYAEEISWLQDGDGLKITMPFEMTGEFAFAFKISFIEK